MIVLIGKVTFILVFGVAASMLMRKSSAAKRSHIWRIAALCAVTLPVLEMLLPRWRMPVMAEAAMLFTVSGEAASDRLPAYMHGNWPAAIWAAGTVILLLRLILGNFLLWRIKRSGRATRCNDVNVIVSPLVRTPLVWGVLRPRILLPDEAAEWPEAQRDIAMAHELAHVKRGDGFTNLLMEAGCAMYWFHPLMWFAAARWRMDSEHASDDAVLAAGFRAPDYAAVLLAASRKTWNNRVAKCPVVLAMNRSSNMKQRIQAVLSNTTDRTRVSGRVLIASLAACFLVLPLAALQATDEKIYKVGGDVKAPHVISKSQPPYTPEARDAKIQGTVLLKVIIDTDGKAKSVTVLRSLDAGLDQEAVKSVQTWKFEPATKDGKPVKVQATIEINYKLR